MTNCAYDTMWCIIVRWYVDSNETPIAVSAQLQSLNAANSGVKDLQQHLAAILQTSNAPEIDETTRQSAGLLLKNNLRDGNTYTAIDVAGLEYIKATLLACMRLQSPTLRRTAASCTAAGCRSASVRRHQLTSAETQRSLATGVSCYLEQPLTPNID